MTSKYDELTDLWINNENEFTEWHLKLRGAIGNFKNFIEESFDLKGKTWNDPMSNSTALPYVYLTDLDDKNIKGSIDNMIADDGSARFKLVIVFERAANAYPKQKFCIPVAIKFSNREIHYGLYNSNSDSVPTWETDICKFELSIIGLLKNHFSFSPFDGFDTRKSIGFL